MVAVLGLVGSLSACGNSSAVGTDSSSTSSAQPQAKKAAPKPVPLDLTGSWKEQNPSKNLTMKATITKDTIDVDWVQGKGDDMLYWSGSYKAPNDAATTYSWTSKGNTDKMKDSPLGSNDKTKDFSYDNDVLTFKVEAMGSVATVTMVRE